MSAGSVLLSPWCWLMIDSLDLVEGGTITLQRVGHAEHKQLAGKRTTSPGNPPEPVQQVPLVAIISPP